LTKQPDSASPIVVGIDGSDSSVQALRWTLGQARLDSTTVEAVTAAAAQIPSPRQSALTAAGVAAWKLRRTESQVKDENHNGPAPTWRDCAGRAIRVG
jgi:Universal stress protein family